MTRKGSTAGCGPVSRTRSSPKHARAHSAVTDVTLRYVDMSAIDAVAIAGVLESDDPASLVFDGRRHVYDYCSGVSDDEDESSTSLPKASPRTRAMLKHGTTVTMLELRSYVGGSAESSSLTLLTDVFGVEVMGESDFGRRHASSSSAGPRVRCVQSGSRQDLAGAGRRRQARTGAMA